MTICRAGAASWPAPHWPARPASLARRDRFTRSRHRRPSSYALKRPQEASASRQCIIVGELLRAEGFAELRYVPVQSADLTKATAQGKADFSLTFVTTFVASIDAGNPITVLAGVHPGCFELFVNGRIHSIRDLKGKSVGVPSVGSPPYRFLSVIASHVGLNPGADINWVTSASVKPMELFADGKIDAFLGFPPEPQELRARGVGRVIVNSALDNHGRDISAACWRQARISSKGIRSPPSACCVLFSRQPISAWPSRNGLLGRWSMEVSPRGMTTRCRH